MKKPHIGRKLPESDSLVTPDVSNEFPGASQQAGKQASKKASMQGFTENMTSSLNVAKEETNQYARGAKQMEPGH